MTFKRRSGSPGGGGWFDKLKRRLRGPSDQAWMKDVRTGSPEQPETEASAASPAPRPPPQTRKKRTLVGRSRPKSGPVRGAWLYVGSFGITLIAGYLIAATVFFPAPFIISDKAVPRVIGMALDEAQTTLADAGFVAGDPDTQNHPSAARGQVVWQDPPGATSVPEGGPVRLTISSGPQLVPVPDIAGYQRDLAQQLIESAGLSVERIETIQTAAARGVAVNTRPATGTTLRPGTAVTLVVSVGAPTISLPNLIGMTLEEARASLEGSGLVLGSSREAPSLRAEGTIFETRPRAGTLVAPGTTVTVVIARRP